MICTSAFFFCVTPSFEYVLFDKNLYLIANLLHAAGVTSFRYSLQWFVEAVFVHTLRKSEASSDVDVRKATLIEAVTYSLYDNICRSLFVRHKLLLSFMITAKIMQDADALDLAVWRFMTSGQVTHNEESGIPESTANPDPDVNTNMRGIIFVDASYDIDKLKGGGST